MPSFIFSQLRGWARSYYTADLHIKAILSYDKPKVPPPHDTAWSQTLQHVRSVFDKLPRVTPISYKSFDKVKWVRSSAAGYGYTGLKGNGYNYPIALQTAITMCERLNHNRAYGPEAILTSTPDVAFTRTQLCQIKVKKKVRNVWGEAFEHVLLEGLFADPLIRMFSEARSFYFIGTNPLLSVPLLIEEILSESDYVYMFDWSGFDATVQEWEIRFAFECLESLLQFPSSVEHEVWRFVIELFIYRKIASPSGHLYLKTLGIPSGSCFTNMIGSITNYVRIQYLFKKLTNDFATVFTHGDDSLVGVPTTQFVPMANFKPLCDHYYWSINIEKSMVANRAEDVGFLSRTVREQQHTRDELVCLRMLMYPEYKIDSGDISTARAYSIFRDSGVKSRYLFNIYRSLNIKYGKAESLPLKLRSWNPLEFELLRQPFSDEEIFI